MIFVGIKGQRLKKVVGWLWKKDDYNFDSIYNLRQKMFNYQLNQHWQTQENDFFGLNAQLNTSSSSLLREVLNKNSEIIKNCLTRFAEVEAKQEEYQATFQRIQKDIGKLAEANRNLQDEIRVLQIRAEKNDTRLSSEVSTIRNSLRTFDRQSMPKLSAKGDFLRNTGDTIIPKIRKKDSVQMRPKNSFDCSRKMEMKESEASEAVGIQTFKLDCSQAKSILIEKAESFCSASDCEIPEEQQSHIEQFTVLKKKARLLKQASVSTQAKQNEKAKIYVSKDDFMAKLREIELKVEERLKECSVNRIDCHSKSATLDGLYRYVDEALKRELPRYATNDYVQKSLVNLKSAWEEEEQQIYVQINSKAPFTALNNLLLKVDSLTQNINSLRPLSNAKPKWASMNQSMVFSSKPSSRAVSREISPQGKENTEVGWGSDFQGQELKNSSAFSSSLSMPIASQGRQLRRQANMDSFGGGLNDVKVSEKTWKDRVGEVLGENRSIRRTKHHN